jgi:hypothetical protein
MRLAAWSLALALLALAAPASAQFYCYTVNQGRGPESICRTDRDGCAESRQHFTDRGYAASRCAATRTVFCFRYDDEDEGAMVRCAVTTASCGAARRRLQVLNRRFGTLSNIGVCRREAAARETASNGAGDTDRAPEGAFWCHPYANAPEGQCFDRLSACGHAGSPGAGSDQAALAACQFTTAGVHCYEWQGERVCYPREGTCRANADPLTPRPACVNAQPNAIAPPEPPPAPARPPPPAVHYCHGGADDDRGQCFRTMTDCESIASTRPGKIGEAGACRSLGTPPQCFVPGPGEEPRCFVDADGCRTVASRMPSQPSPQCTLATPSPAAGSGGAWYSAPAGGGR